ncbi:MAG: hypothetical protein OXH37_03895, partial [Gammaproteobacteria bacterium]|nr:hypothetical protein [Gammaproteobacteria bacterium]
MALTVAVTAHARPKAAARHAGRGRSRNIAAMGELDHTDPALTNETIELLQQLIRNACVNDGTVESGEEVRNSDLLETFLEGAGVDVESFESEPGRRSLVARISGTDPAAPKLCLMGHTDVVPVNPGGW